jgi:hypothetical protein
MGIGGVNYPKIAQHFRSVNDYKSPRFYNVIYIYNILYIYTHILLFKKTWDILPSYQPQAVHLRHWVFTCFYPRVCWDGASHAHEALERNFGGLKKEESWYGWWGEIVFFGMLKVGLFQKLHFSVGKHDDQLWSFRLPHFQTNPNH